MKQLLTSPEVAAALVQALWEIGLYVLGVLLAAGVAATPLLVRWFRAHGWAITAEQEQQLLRLAPLAAQGVEEYVRNAQKAGLTLTSNEKLDQAVSIARSLAADGLRHYTDDKLKAVIEASLPKVRAELQRLPMVPIAKIG